MMKKFLSSAFACLLVSAFACAQAKDSARTAEGKPSVVKKSYNIGGKMLSFTVETGYLDWKDDKNEVKAKMFYIAYVKDGESEKNRPVTFAFNGGPGSSSLWLHLGCLGPRRILMNDNGDAPAPPYTLVDNDMSWLDMTDLVFIDPVGTGFSRPAKGEKEQQFYGYKNDISSVGEFIRLFLNKQHRWGSPKYVIGESYGTTRAAGLSKYLIDEHGLYLNGIILMSPALDFEMFREFENNDMASMCYLPSYTATAFYHKKLKPSLQVDLQSTLRQAESFIYNQYSAALLKGNSLSKPEKDSVASKLADFTGLSKSFILKNNLRIYSERFRKFLFNDSSLSVGRFDGRLKVYEPDPVDDDCANDASFTKIRGAFSTSINYYLRSELKYDNDLPYNIIAGVSPWEYANGKYLNVMPALADAMIQNPDMKVWISCGLFDIATPYFGAIQAVNHMNIPEASRKNISFTYYEAGHMMYLLKPCLDKLKKDAVNFYK